MLRPHLCHENGTGLTQQSFNLYRGGAGPVSGEAMHYEHEMGFAIATLIAWSLVFVGAGLLAIFA